MRFRARFPSGTYSAQASVSWSPGEDHVRRSQPALFYVDGRNPTMFGVADLEATFNLKDRTGHALDVNRVRSED
jgi:hypothetical protein